VLAGKAVGPQVDKILVTEDWEQWMAPVNIFTKVFVTRGTHNFRDWCCHLYSSSSSAMQPQIIVLANVESQYTKCNSARWAF
jgi:hypothetical protein